MFNFFLPFKAKEKLSVRPKHIAIIMDGNGRWAKKRLMPRISGHRKGLESVRTVISQCNELNIPFLTLFAFSTENWLRPQKEVNFLMSLFWDAMKKESPALNKHNIRFKLIGDRKVLTKKLIDKVNNLEKMTEKNTGLTLSIAMNYGGKWDILYALKAHQKKYHSNKSFTERSLAKNLSLNFAPDPDLLIRTGGEKRISNFLIWQVAYTELYFTETLWPDFNKKAFIEALLEFQRRERRYGKTSEQL